MSSGFHSSFKNHDNFDTFTDSPHTVMLSLQAKIKVLLKSNLWLYFLKWQVRAVRSFNLFHSDYVGKLFFQELGRLSNIDIGQISTECTPHNTRILVRGHGLQFAKVKFLQGYFDFWKKQKFRVPIIRSFNWRVIRETCILPIMFLYFSAYSNSYRSETLY